MTVDVRFDRYAPQLIVVVVDRDRLHRDRLSPFMRYAAERVRDTA